MNDLLSILTLSLLQVDLEITPRLALLVSYQDIDLLNRISANSTAGNTESEEAC